LNRGEEDEEGHDRQPERSQPDLCDEDTLVVHTETGMPSTVCQIRATWKTFVYEVDPELAHITQTVLISSFVANLINRYRLGQMFRGVSEESFHNTLASMLNTSVDMLRDVYCACDTDDYRSTVIDLMQMYASPDEDEISGSNEYKMPDSALVANKVFRDHVGGENRSRWRTRVTQTLVLDYAAIDGDFGTDDIDFK
jgi:hypothetical protein